MKAWRPSVVFALTYPEAYIAQDDTQPPEATAIQAMWKQNEEPWGGNPSSGKGVQPATVSHVSHTKAHASVSRISSDSAMLVFSPCLRNSPVIFFLGQPISFSYAILRTAL